MPLYENVFIARQDISGQQAEALTEAFAKVIEDNGGSVGKKEYWGLRSLAFRIKKNRKGHYTLLNIDAPAEAVHELERQMRIHEDVLRYQTIRVDALEEGPSMILQNRGGGRDERRRDDRPRGPRGPRPEGRGESRRDEGDDR